MMPLIVAKFHFSHFCTFLKTYSTAHVKITLAKNLREATFLSMKFMQRDHELNSFQETQDKEHCKFSQELTECKQMLLPAMGTGLSTQEVC